MQRIVITGMGAITPIGLTVAETWANLFAGNSGVGPITLFDATNFPVRIAGEVKNFDARNYMDFKESRRSHRSAHFAIAATREALADSGFTVDSTNAENVGVVINTGGGGIQEIGEAALLLEKKGPGRIGPFVVPNAMANAPACHVSILTGANGPIVTSTSACASGSQALFDAMHILKRGDADVIIAGATEATIIPVAVASFANAGALSKCNGDPTHASRPFDAERDGFVLAEGAVVLIMETEEHACARGARIYAEVAGGALTGDAHHITAPEPEGNGARRAMIRALRSADMQPTDIDLVMAHGTSTPLNDATETKALKAVFGDHAYKLAVSATKSTVGHMVGAAGAFSAMAAAKSICESIIPPTINLDHPDPVCDLDYVPNKLRAAHPNAAMINAFGFGGQNAVVILRRCVQ